MGECSVHDGSVPLATLDACHAGGKSDLRFQFWVRQNRHSFVFQNVGWRSSSLWMLRTKFQLCRKSPTLQRRSSGRSTVSS